ncbi:MAG: P-loop NTPase fold protein [Bacteroidales bacterium]
MKENHPINLLEGNPITKIEEDVFGRGEIVKNLTDYIHYRKDLYNPKCFTIGLYGKWGEGKTSILNMVESELLSKKDNIVLVRYNPWFLKDQESVLLDFFNSICAESFDKKVINLIKKYGSVISLGTKGILGLSGVPLIGEFLDYIIKAIKGIDNNKPISKQKDEVNEAIKNSGKHLVVFVDDLDRLDCEEIHAVLKLIRQNTDFDNTTYILSMDYHIVTQSINSYFSDKKENSGKSFLDKIIQFPLHLPTIQKMHLNKFAEIHIDELLSRIWKNPKEEINIKDLKYNLETYVNPLFLTPRDIIQYVNILNYIVPTLYKEVDLSDLFLLEALKKFSYDSYDKIRNRRHIFISNPFFTDYYLAEKYKKDEEKEDIRKKNIESIHINNTYNKAIYINKIIDILLNDYLNIGGLKNRKKLCDPNFFDKYFLYTTPDNQIPEKEINTLTELIGTAEINEIVLKLNEYNEQYGFDEIRRTIDTIVRYRDIENYEKLISNITIAFSLMDNAIKDRIYFCSIVDRNIFGNLLEEVDDAVKLNYRLIFEIANSIVDKADINFSMELALQMVNNYAYVCKNDYDELIRKIINKYISLNGEISLFNIESPRTKVFILKYWNFAMPENFLEAKKNVIEDDKLDIIGLISSFMQEEKQDGYLKLIELFDKDKLKEKLDKKISLVQEYDKQYIDLFNKHYEFDKPGSKE